VANEYVTLVQLKLHLGGISFSTDDALLDAARAAASRRIDERCGRRFYADGSVTARTYNLSARVTRNAQGEEGLIVDDISTPTGLVVEVGSGTYTTIASSSYTTEPENAIVRGLPIQVIRLPLGTPWGQGTGAQARITANWGWPATPDAIIEATYILAARLYRRKDSPDGAVGNAEWGVMRLGKLDPDVEALVAGYALPGFA